jgi:DNA-binding beta-propeller fold protein YncE
VSIGVSIDATGDVAMTRIGTALTVCVVVMVGACAPSGRSGDASQPAAAPAGLADVLVLRDGDGSGAAPYVLVDGDDGRVLSRLPAGVPAPDWHVLFASHAVGASTVIRAIDPTSGTTDREISIPGAWQLPSVGIDREPGGLSVDGRTLVLEEATADGSAVAAPSTRFAIVATAGTSVPRVIALPGRLTFDALSPDGRLLYVLDHVEDGRYSVRQVDVVSGRLAEGTIVDKRNPDEQMAGDAITQIPGADGWVYTLYRGTDGAFIHALDTQHGGAFCIDLTNADSADEATIGRWGLALDPARQMIYAANGALGVLEEVSLDSFSVIRTKTFAAGAPNVSLAELGHGEGVGGGTAAGDQVAASADGSMLYVVGDFGLVSVASRDLRPVGRLGGDRRYRGLALSPTGELYVLDDGGTVSRLDPGNGHLSASAGRSGFSAIVAVLSMP